MKGVVIHVMRPYHEGPPCSASTEEIVTDEESHVNISDDCLEPNDRPCVLDDEA